MISFISLHAELKEISVSAKTSLKSCDFLSLSELTARVISWDFTEISCERILESFLNGNNLELFQWLLTGEMSIRGLN